MSSSRKLVIVESPAKARTIAGYLGNDWDVEASVGHIRDIPTPSEMPVEMKKGPFGKFGVDIEQDLPKGPFFISTGISLGVGMSRMWPTDASTSQSLPR